MVRILLIFFCAAGLGAMPGAAQAPRLDDGRGALDARIPSDTLPGPTGPAPVTPAPADPGTVGPAPRGPEAVGPASLGRTDRAEDDARPAAAPASPRGRIVLHHTARYDPDVVQRLSAYLGDRIGAPVEVRPVGVAPDDASTRYFFAGDERLANVVHSTLGRVGLEAEVRNFTDFEPAPTPGLVEIWLPK